MTRTKGTKFLVAALLLAVTIALSAPYTAAQITYKTLYRFPSSKLRGAGPTAGLISDAAGNLYGTTASGGEHDGGVVFELVRESDGSWKEQVIHQFGGSGDGVHPFAALVFDQQGGLYGTTYSRSDSQATGTVFKLTPNLDGSWSETVLYDFCSLPKCVDGGGPWAGLIFDEAGNLYGTTTGGGPNEWGTVFKLTPNSDGSWVESVLYSFCALSNCRDGASPYSSLIFDGSGNLYGGTVSGDHEVGVIFELSPNQSGSWTESVLHEGGMYMSGLIFDQSGNLYGEGLTRFGNGVVFRLRRNTDGQWTKTVLHAFTGGGEGSDPTGGLTFDATGNLYGTTTYGGSQRCNYGCGLVFKLSPSLGGGWKETVLHDFYNNPGAYPYDMVVFDSAGNLYGTTGGYFYQGSVFEIQAAAP